MTNNASSFTLISDFDIHLFKEGRHYKLYEKLGSHIINDEERTGTFFAVWAPDASEVSLIGNFNHWNKEETKMFPRWDSSGIWEIFVDGLGAGETYKFAIKTKEGSWLEKADPFAFYSEEAPRTASITWKLDHKWKDKKWLNSRKKGQSHKKPMSVYEVHLGSWKKRWEEGDRNLTYKELAVELTDYVKDTGFTHVEFLPIMEHPFYGSWGYQVLGYFAPTSRYGNPQDFMFLVESLHKAGIGVILDWVPSHFPGDDHGLYKFDGSHLFEHADPRKGYHPDWTSYIFNYGRNEIKSFLISSALFWLDIYHADGIRVDAVASMLYLDYSRKEGEWVPNHFGGRENLEAVQFLREFNEAVYGAHPDTVTIAEESTSWPNVSRPTFNGGLGFGQKWMMGWMHDTLEYFTKEPVYRKFHQNEITFSFVYAFTENFMLPLSHDEVVHGKGAIIGRMPGDDWQRFANLRLLYGSMYMHPGTKLMFMGNEFGQQSEWKHDSSLDWFVLEYNHHRGVRNWVKALNDFYKSTPALYERQFEQNGFEWIDYSDHQNSVMAFARKGDKKNDYIVAILNFTPIHRTNYRIGMPLPGKWIEILNSDKEEFGGSNLFNGGDLITDDIYMHGRPQSLELNLSPMALMVFKLA